MQIVSYFRETRGELQHVSWPQLTKVGIFTVLVVIFSIGMAYILGLVDIGFIRGMSEARQMIKGDTVSSPLPADIQQQIEAQLQDNVSFTTTPAETPATPTEDN